jgi:hypothetical protein
MILVFGPVLALCFVAAGKNDSREASAGQASVSPQRPASDSERSAGNGRKVPASEGESFGPNGQNESPKEAKSPAQEQPPRAAGERGLRRVLQSDRKMEAEETSQNIVSCCAGLDATSFPRVAPAGAAFHSLYGRLER